MLDPFTQTIQPEWRRQLRDRITTTDQLADWMELTADRRAALNTVAQRYPIGITPYYLGLIDPADQSDPIRLQCVPHISELKEVPGHCNDPFGETDQAACGVIQRYANRAVFFAHHDCAVRCRHCTRKNTWQTADAVGERLDSAVGLIRETPAINEIILTGGDPLLMETQALAQVIDAFRSLKQIDVIRIGTRVPVSLPMRIDDELCRMLSGRRPIWINTHFNHPREITAISAAACDLLLRCGIPVSNQTVLLRGINDSFPVLKSLCENLFKIMVRPYYLFDADPVRGTGHFHVPQRRGRALHAQLQSTLSGLALPRYAADVPGLPHKRILQ